MGRGRYRNVAVFDGETEISHVLTRRRNASAISLGCEVESENNDQRSLRRMGFDRPLRHRCENPSEGFESLHHGFGAIGFG